MYPTAAQCQIFVCNRRASVVSIAGNNPTISKVDIGSGTERDNGDIKISFNFGYAGSVKKFVSLEENDSFLVRITI